jgi:hypothetical protein
MTFGDFGEGPWMIWTRSAGRSHLAQPFGAAIWRSHLAQPFGAGGLDIGGGQLDEAAAGHRPISINLKEMTGLRDKKVALLIFLAPSF